MAGNKDDVARTVAALEADLRRVRHDAEALGRDIKILRAEKEKNEVDQSEEALKVRRKLKQAQSELRVVTEQLERQKEKTYAAQERLESHVCAA
jgi:DNA replicative helicase MCM subunit Mcm2 (Cdc46/Mcm family)